MYELKSKAQFTPEQLVELLESTEKSVLLTEPTWIDDEFNILEYNILEPGGLVLRAIEICRILAEKSNERHQNLSSILDRAKTYTMMYSHNQIKKA